MKPCMYAVNKLRVLFTCEAICINLFVIKMYLNRLVSIIHSRLYTEAQLEKIDYTGSQSLFLHVQ